MPRVPSLVPEPTSAHLAFTIVLALLFVAQAALGLLFPHAYRDAAWITATWFGNDLVTLLVAAPLLVGAGVMAARGSARARLLWLGTLGYGVYNYAFYLLGAALNVFFPIYVLACVTSAAALIVGLARCHPDAVARSFSLRTPARLVGGYYLVVAAGLSVVWFGMWAAYVFAGRPTPVEPEAFRLVAALDTTLMVPALTAGGVLLWRRRPWGYVIASIAGVQGTLYLLVLSLNSAIAIARGLVVAPGELPVWGTLFVLTAAATVRLLASAHKAEP